MLTWPEIKVLYPDLAARLRAGDLEARVEFARLSFNAEIISVHDHRVDRRGPTTPPQKR